MGLCEEPASSVVLDLGGRKLVLTITRQNKPAKKVHVPAILIRPAASLKYPTKGLPIPWPS